MIFKIVDTKAIVSINEAVCIEGNNPFHCFDEGKVESALHSAFYPGTYPYHHGGIAKVAGALAIYICQAPAFEDGNKRTAALAAIIFLNANGLGINYPQYEDRDDLSRLIIDIAKGTLAIEATKNWFEAHKVRLRL